ncbi:MAG: 5-formyltetrahydrofolate cyclo-ligase [Bacteroidales bacterium]
MGKSELRQEIKAVKRLLAEETKIACAIAVKKAIEKNANFTSAKKILLYHSLPDELSTADMITCWNEEKEIFLPSVDGDTITIHKYTPEKMKIGAFGIKEASGKIIPPEEIDLIIVPGVAFDEEKNRLGRGKGFYDKLLANVKCYKIGIAYEIQIVNTIPCMPHDIKMDCIITEKRAF